MISRWYPSLFVFAWLLVQNALAQDSRVVEPEKGRNIYEQHCLACHQADGSGVPGLAPPLIKGAFVEGDPERLIKILLHGLEGVEINGESYANPMPAFDHMTDEEMADVLTYVRNNFTNKAEPITAEHVNQVRKKVP